MRRKRGSEIRKEGSSLEKRQRGRRKSKGRLRISAEGWRKRSKIDCL